MLAGEPEQGQDGQASHDHLDQQQYPGVGPEQIEGHKEGQDRRKVVAQIVLGEGQDRGAEGVAVGRVPHRLAVGCQVDVVAHGGIAHQAERAAGKDNSQYKCRDCHACRLEPAGVVVGRGGLGCGTHSEHSIRTGCVTKDAVVGRAGAPGSQGL